MTVVGKGYPNVGGLWKCWTAKNPDIVSGDMPVQKLELEESDRYIPELIKAYFSVVEEGTSVLSIPGTS